MAGARRINAKRTTASDGTALKSRFEGVVYEAILEEGCSPHYEEETFEYTLVYNPDYAPRRHSDGKQIIIEAKGFFDTTDRRKILAVLRSNPELRDRFFLCFQNPRSKASKTMSYADWSNKHDIRWITPDGIKDALR